MATMLEPEVVALAVGGIRPPFAGEADQRDLLAAEPHQRLFSADALHAEGEQQSRVERSAREPAET